jgi:hypothetical protein
MRELPLRKTIAGPVEALEESATAAGAAPPEVAPSVLH